MKEFIVPYRLTTHGYALIEAEDAEQAFDIVERGQFDADPGETWVDWGADGPAVEND